MDKVEIIERISILRVRANLSARALSIRIGKNEGYINRMESKKDFLPTLESLMDIICECHSSFEEFFYYKVNQYAADKEIISLLKSTPENKKKAIVTMIS